MDSHYCPVHFSLDLAVESIHGSRRLLTWKSMMGSTEDRQIEREIIRPVIDFCGHRTEQSADSVSLINSNLDIEL